MREAPRGAAAQGPQRPRPAPGERLRLLVASWLVATAGSAAAETQCGFSDGSPITLPDALFAASGGYEGEVLPCPHHPDFLDRGSDADGVFVAGRGFAAGNESSARLPRKADAEEDGGAEPTAAETAAASGMQDCTHEIGMQLMWTQLARRDLRRKDHPSRVVLEVERGIYEANLFRAQTKSYYSTHTVGALKRIQLLAPGKHFVGDHRLAAELHLDHVGQDGGPDFKVVVPISIEWAWEDKPSTFVAFLSSAEDDRDQKRCSWLDWVEQGFKCPFMVMPEHFVAPNQDRTWFSALHFVGLGCQHTFFVTKSLRMTHYQLEAFNLTAEGPGPLEEAPKKPAEIVLSVALGPNQEFSVFSRAERTRRRITYYGLIAVFMIALVAVFCLVRRYNTEYEVEMVKFATDRWLHVNLRVDHWVSYAAAIAVPCGAYFAGVCHRQSGMPYEWLAAMCISVYCHCIHELVMYVQIGGAAKRIGYLEVVKWVCLSACKILHYQLQVEFMVIAHMHGSWLPFISAIVFFMSNIVAQLVLTTMTEDCSAVIFEARGFKVISAVFKAQLLEHAKTERELLRDQPGMEREISSAGSKSTVSSFREGALASAEGRFLLMVTACGDAFQTLIMLMYVLRYGQTLVVTGSLCLTALILLEQCVNLKQDDVYSDDADA